MDIEFRGRRITIDMPGWYSGASGESIHNGGDLRVPDRALNRLKADVEGLPLPEEIRRIRRKLRLTQEEAGELIGGGPRAFQKYEAGDLLPGRAIGSALALLDRDPSGLSVLKHRSKRVNREILA